MMIHKKDRFENRGGKIHEIAGKWGQDFILAPIETADDECLIYTPGEMKELLETGYFKKAGGKKR